MAGVTMQGGLNAMAADVLSGASLTCKESMLVGWGGATDEDMVTCPVLRAEEPGSILKLQGCSVWLHPDSTHPLPAVILLAMDQASIRASGCKLTGPAPGSSPAKAVGAGADTHATIALVSAAASALSVQLQQRYTATSMAS
jgi:hypothetical protein